MTLTPYALVRRHPSGGFAVVHGYIEVSGIPKVDPDIHSAHMTLQYACEMAKKDGMWSVDPECYKPRGSLTKGLWK